MTGPLRPRALHILVTGAGSGFGRRLAVALAARGHQVTAATLTDSEAEELAALQPGLATLAVDITDPDDRRPFRDLDIDVLVNNAGIGQAGPLRSIPEELVRRVFEVNVFGTLAVTQDVLPRMIERGQGRILIMSSVAGVLAGPMTGPYAMTKHALQAMGSALRAELAPLGVDVALVNPGPFATGFNDVMIDETTAWFSDADAFPSDHELLDRTRNRITGNQLDPDDAVTAIIGLVEADSTELVNFIPADIIDRISGHD